MAGLKDFYNNSGNSGGFNRGIFPPPQYTSPWKGRGKNKRGGRGGGLRSAGKGYLATFMKIANWLGATGAAKRGYSKMFKNDDDDDKKGRKGGAKPLGSGGYGYPVQDYSGGFGKTGSSGKTSFDADEWV